jgi:hypothetical protein
MIKAREGAIRRTPPPLTYNYTPPPADRLTGGPMAVDAIVTEKKIAKSFGELNP